MAMAELEEEKQHFQLVTATLRGDGTAYAIKNEDFPLLKTAIQTMAGLAGGVATFAPAAIAGLLVLLVNYRKKGIELNANQAAIVRELKENPGLTKEQLCALLVKTLDEPTVSTELEKLRHLLNNSGEFATIVRTDSEGRWYTIDI